MNMEETAERRGPAEVNVNDYVWVKLTPTGEAELDRQHKELLSRYPRVFSRYRTRCESRDGYERFQLWDLMQRLGSLLALSGPAPFETVILLSEPSSDRPTGNKSPTGSKAEPQTA